MKAQCERCKEIVPLEFTLEVEGIRVRCPECRESYSVAASGPPAEAPKVTPFPGSRMTCPKCGEEQPRAEACRRCGLVPSKWQGVLGAADGSQPELASARDAAGLWAAVEASWEVPARHDAFLAHCQKTGSYAFAASRYRAALAQRPGDVVAEQRLRQVRSLAELALLSPRPKQEDEPTPFRGTVLVLGVIVLLVVGGLAWALLSAAPR